MTLLRQREGRLCYGRTTWMGRDELRAVAENAPDCQAWWLGAGRRFTSTVRVGRWWFRSAWDHDQDRMASAIEALLSHGYDPRVSNWGACWRIVGTFISPPPKPIRAVLKRGDWPFPWVEQAPGCYEGSWEEWDMCAAYPWAGMTRGGLPAPWSMEVSFDPTPCDEAVHLVRSFRQTSHQPERIRIPPWARGCDYSTDRVMLTEDGPAWCHWIPGEVANHLGIEWDARDHIVSIQWRRTIDLEPAFDRIAEVFPENAAKHIRASYWGSWAKGAACNTGLFVRGTPTREWSLPNATNPLLAGLIQARVTSRVADVSEGSPRVFVDSVLLENRKRPADQGTKPGQWKLKKSWLDGVAVPEHPRKPVDIPFKA